MQIEMQIIQEDLEDLQHVPVCLEIKSTLQDFGW